MPDVEFAGFKTPLPGNIIFDSWREYRKQGTLLHEFLNQPLEWWKDVWMLDAIHAVCSEEAHKEADKG